jgi:UDP-N-acetylglucosamine 2-epimerase (non-hydrolysing)
MGKRIMVALGTRPECIKLAPVVAAMRARPRDFETILCSSGQQREMLDQTLAALELGVDRDLNVMQPDQSLADLTAALVTGFSSAISDLSPDWILVQGDTTTAFAAALSAYYQRIPIGHVEAGLRSNDRFNPFPEEINRRFISSVADLHFAPTAAAANALRSEGMRGDTIHVTGNTAVDALLALQSRLETPDGGRHISKAIRDLADSSAFVLVTCHRRENFGEHLGAILRAIRRIALGHRAYRVIFPVHFNPHVRASTAPILGDIPNIHLLDPVSYPDSIYLLSRASLVLTDSGGLQEEAPSFGVPVLVLRLKTERPEAIEAGLAELVGVDEDRIVARAADLLARPTGRARRSISNPFGDGRASERIAEVLAKVR